MHNRIFSSHIYNESKLFAKKEKEHYNSSLKFNPIKNILTAKKKSKDKPNKKKRKKPSIKIQNG